MFSIYKRNLQIPIAKKLEIIEYSKIHGKNKAAQYVGVSLNVGRYFIIYYEIFWGGHEHVDVSFVKLSGGHNL